MNIMKTMTMMRIMTYKGNMKIAKYRRRRVHYEKEEIKNDENMKLMITMMIHGQHEHDEHDQNVENKKNNVNVEQ